MNEIHSWLSIQGLRISIQETKFIIFQKPRTKLVTLSHLLVITNNIIPQVDTNKVLGPRNSTSAIPGSHISKPRACESSISSKSSRTRRFDVTVKFQSPLYTTLIGSILDYGSPIYGLTPLTQVNLLNLIQNCTL